MSLDDCKYAGPVGSDFTQATYHEYGPPPVYTSSSSPSTPMPPLAHPVVIPQRRPGDKERGFVTAYAPCLQQYGIDEAAFLEFIRNCNKAVQGSPILSAVQVAAFGTGFTPELIVMGVATAVQLGAAAVNSVSVKWKTNAFLDKYNEQLFRPRGLYCLIMTYSPTATSDEETNSSGTSTPSFSSGSSWRRNLRDPFTTDPNGGGRLPENVAPLVFHNNLPPEQGLEEDSKPASVGKKVKKAFARFENYLDRRAQAQYAAENEGDILAMNQPPRTGFSNRYLDPNHPATNNGLIGLLSGGHITQDPEKKRQQKMAQLTEEADRARSEYERRLDDIRRNNYSASQMRQELAREDAQFQRQMADITKRMEEAETGTRRIKKNILYLTIVTMPSANDLAAATRRLGSTRDAEVAAVQV